MRSIQKIRQCLVLRIRKWSQCLQDVKKSRHMYKKFLSAPCERSGLKALDKKFFLCARQTYFKIQKEESDEKETKVDNRSEVHMCEA